MARYSLNLPTQLKLEAEREAAAQGVSLNQFILWAVAQKVESLNRSLDDPRFPQVTYRRGASGVPVPVLRGTGIRVQTLVLAGRSWGWSSSRIAEEYGLSPLQVDAALGFYEAHPEEIDIAVTRDEELAATGA